MIYQDLKSRVENKAKELFNKQLFAACLKQHIKHGYRSRCRCEMCRSKREMINNLYFKNRVAIFRQEVKKVLDNK